MSISNSNHFTYTVLNQRFDAFNVVRVEMPYSKFEYGGDLNPNFALADIVLQILVKQRI
jgi:hypothetical protein